MRARLEKYRRIQPDSATDYSIGCVLLQSPFFFGRDEWIPVSDWSREIVRGKGYSTDDARGQEIWSEVENRLRASPILADAAAAAGQSSRFGQPQTFFPRLRQGAFRVIVTDLYKRQCAVTHSHVLHVLDAAHIRPYGQGGTHDPTNGLLLRQDVHTLFDRGHLTITPDYHLEVSRRIKEEFNNGKEYYFLHGSNILVPDEAASRPSAEQLT